MQTLWFVIPAHGRLPLAQVCYRQLRRTCDALAGRGIDASAVVIADDENLDLAHDNGFATVERDNKQLGRKINDGYELAGREGVEYMAALGNDDWVDPNWIRLPESDREIICTRFSAIVNETGDRMARLILTYPGGDGVRIYPASLLAEVGFRPADEDRRRAIDTSTHVALTRAGKPSYRYHDLHLLQIVDFKSAANLNDYDGCRSQFGRRQPESHDPFGDLAAIYPDEAIREMRALYSRELVAA